MTCEVCDGYTDANGNDRTTPDPRSQATDGMRSQRLMRAVLTSDENIMNQVLAEIGDCRNCLGRQVMCANGWAAQALVHMAGSTDEALKWVEHGMAEDIGLQF